MQNIQNILLYSQFGIRYKDLNKKLGESREKWQGYELHIK